MGRIERIHTDLIRSDPFNPFNPWSISPPKREHTTTQIRGQSGLPRSSLINPI